MLQEVERGEKTARKMNTREISSEEISISEAVALATLSQVIWILVFGILIY